MKFTIITPSFNQRDFIERTIDSVVAQEGDFEIEYYVMDGGSTDGTVEILKHYESLATKGKIGKGCNSFSFSWVSKKDKGQSDAINKGLARATGEIVAFLNSDDTYLPGTLARVAKVAADPNNMWFTGYCRIVNECDKNIQGGIVRYKNYWLNHYSYNKLLVLNFIAQPATFWRRKVISEIGMFDPKLHYTMDYDYWLRLGRHYRPAIIKSFVAAFRIHSQSKGKKYFVKQFREDYETMTKYTQSRRLIRAHQIHNAIINPIYHIIK